MKVTSSELQGHINHNWPGESKRIVRADCLGQFTHADVFELDGRAFRFQA